MDENIEYLIEHVDEVVKAALSGNHYAKRILEECHLYHISKKSTDRVYFDTRLRDAIRGFEYDRNTILRMQQDVFDIIKARSEV